MQAKNALIIPVFNGERHVLSLFVQLEAFLSIRNDWDIYIVNDGSTDNTAAFLRLISQSISNNVTILSYDYNKGKGGAIAYAVKHLGESYEYIGYTDIEIPYTFAPLISAVEIMNTNERVSVVIGDRTLSDETQYSRYRQFAHQLFRFFVPASVRKFGDTQCGLKVFRTSLAKTLFGELQTTRWVFDIEILSKAIAMGVTVRTIPVVIKPSCKQGVGGLTFLHSSVSVVKDIVAIRYPAVYRFVAKYHWQSLLSVFIFLSFVWFFQAITLGFFSDDFLALAVARDTSFWSYFGTNIFGTKTGGSYGPMWNWIVEVQYYLFGLHASLYHIVSIIVHGCNAFLLTVILYLLTKKRAISFGVGVFFLTLVGHVESVVWFASQVHLFATLFFLLGLYFYIRSVKENKRGLYICSLVFVILALFTKEITLTSVLIYPLIGLWARREESGKSLYTHCVQTVKEMIPIIIALGTFFVLRHGVTNTGALSYYGGGFSTLTYYHISQFFIGISLSHVLPFIQRTELWSFLFIYKGWLFLALSIGSFWLISKKKYRTVFFFVLYHISLIPYSVLFLNAFSYEGERYGYLPGLFFAATVVFFFVELYQIFPNIRKFATAFIVIICLFWFVGSRYTVSTKVSNWREADVWISQVLDDARQIPWDSLGYAYVIGLPDSYAGAHLLRNGFLQAMQLENNISINGEAPYLLSSVFGLPDAKLQKNIVMSCSQKRGICSFRAKENMFIGYPSISVLDGAFTLENVDSQSLLAQTILFTPTFGWCDLHNEISFVWYDVQNGLWSYTTVTPSMVCNGV